MFISERFERISSEFAHGALLRTRILEEALNGHKQETGNKIIQRAFIHTAVLNKPMETCEVIITKKGAVARFQLGYIACKDMQRFKMLFLRMVPDVAGLKDLMGISIDQLEENWFPGILRDAVHIAMEEKVDGQITPYLAALPSLNMIYGGESYVNLYGADHTASMESNMFRPSPTPLHMFGQDCYKLLLIPE